MDLLRIVCGKEGFPNVEIDKVDGLLAEYARRKNVMVIVKGLRAMSDFEYEFQQALTNKKLNPELETMFLATSAENMFVSSSMVKQVAGFGGDISHFVPECISDTIIERLCERKAEAYLPETPAIPIITAECRKTADFQKSGRKERY